MQKIEIITASGKSTPVPIGLDKVKIIQPGSTVKISVTKELIGGSQKDGNNLILVEKNGSKITIEDFFKTDGVLKNKLILEDGGKAYEAKYNVENFTGLAFFPVKQAADNNADGGEMSTAVWLVPLLVAAAAGIGIAIYNSNDGGSSHSSKSSNDSNSKEKQALSDVQKDVDSKDNALINAQKALDEAVKAMQANPSSVTIKAVEETSVAVKTVMDGLNQVNVTLKNAIDAAKAKGIDTTAAEKIHKQAAEDISGAKSSIDNAEKLAKTAIALTDESAKVIAEQAKLEYKSASDAAVMANKQPGQLAIDDAKAKSTTADTTLSKLDSQIDQLTQLLAKAKEQGFNVDNATARLKNLLEQQASLQQESKVLVNSLAQAEKSLQELDAAHRSVDKANEAVKQAQALKKVAEEKLASALVLKEQALKNNQLDRVNEVNKIISEANKSLETARQAADAANNAVAKANADIDRINPAVDPSVKPHKVTSVETSGLSPIDKGLQIDNNKTLIESVQTFVKSLVDSVSNVWQTIVNSKPLAFFGKVVSEIITGIKTVGDVIGGQIVSVIDSIKIVGKTLADVFINKPIDFFKDVISITWQKVTQAVSETFSTVKAGFDAVFSGIGKAITDALQGMSLFDWVNPIKWISLVSNVITNSIGNVVKGIADVLIAIPGKIIDFLLDGINKYIGAFSDKVKAEFNIIKGAISDVVKTLFDGFIKNPIEKLLSPILSKIVDVLSHPIESLQKLVSDIIGLAKDAFNIVKNIIELPTKWLSSSFQLIKDIVNSFKGDNVKNGDGSELQKLVGKMLSDQQADTSKVINSLLKSDSSSGDINLSKLVHESATSKIQLVADSNSSVTNYHTTSVVDDMHSSLSVAA